MIIWVGFNLSIFLTREDYFHEGEDVGVAQMRSGTVFLRLLFDFCTPTWALTQKWKLAASSTASLFAFQRAQRRSGNKHEIRDTNFHNESHVCVRDKTFW